MRSFLSGLGAILWKDLVAELRTQEILGSMLVFALLVLLIFTVAFDLRRSELLSLAPGVLWVAFSFAGVLGLNRSFVLEKDVGSLEALLLAPIDRGAIYVSKMLGNFLFMLLLEAITLPLFALTSGLAPPLEQLLPFLLLGTLGYAAVGTLLAAMAVNTRTREVMLPVLLFPLVIPVVIAAVKGTELALRGRAFGEGADWMNLLISFDVIFLVASFLVFEYVIEE